MNLGVVVDLFATICLCCCIMQIARLSSTVDKFRSQFEEEIDSLKKELKDRDDNKVEVDLNKRLDDLQRMKFSPINLRVITSRKEHK